MAKVKLQQAYTMPMSGGWQSYPKNMPLHMLGKNLTGHLLQPRTHHHEQWSVLHPVQCRPHTKSMRIAVYNLRGDQILPLATISFLDSQSDHNKADTLTLISIQNLLGIPSRQWPYIIATLLGNTNWTLFGCLTTQSEQTCTRRRGV